MGQKKLVRFEEIKTFPNVLQYPSGMKGNWKSFFKNENPLTLELACGKGEYTIGLAKLYPAKNFIGVDIKGNRIWRGAKTALELGLYNVAFLRTEIEKLGDYFGEGEVHEIWITFPDPQLRLSKMKKRLTHPKFLRLYQNILQKDGMINLKTDSPDLYHFTKTVISFYCLQLLADYEDAYSEKNLSEELLIQTHYEKLDIAQSNKIHYLQFKLNGELSGDKDIFLKEMFREQHAC
jgi:tRNA (guanine-N7-)-methyltransferase